MASEAELAALRVMSGSLTSTQAAVFDAPDAAIYRGRAWQFGLTPGSAVVCGTVRGERVTLCLHRRDDGTYRTRTLQT